MSLRLYLDECAYSKQLASLLRRYPYEHYVEAPTDSDLFGGTDEEQFAYARSHGLIVVTKNPDDFENLHLQHPDHPGIFAIYRTTFPPTCRLGASLARSKIWRVPR